MASKSVTAVLAGANTLKNNEFASAFGPEKQQFLLSLATKENAVKGTVLVAHGTYH